MSWLQTLDSTLFHQINQQRTHGLLDQVMPYFSGNAAFFPMLVVLGLVIIRQGGIRGLSLVLMLAAAALIASNWVCGPLKEYFMRPRPAMTLENVRLILGNGMGSMSMPSCHATNWGAIAMVACLFHGPSWRLVVPLALLVAYSRVYLGVHYPSDVWVGLCLGAATGATVVGLGTLLWRMVGRRLFPEWWLLCPSLLVRRPTLPIPDPQRTRAVTWRNATWVILLLLFVGRIAYIASDTIELSEDEAYQWMWSQRLDWAYYSKPPMIAWIQWLGTHLWGDTAFGVRFFSPVLALGFGLLWWAFLRRYTDERTVFWTVLALAVTPLFAVGSTLLTVDAPTVFFYSASLFAVWLALERDSTVWWGLAGVAMALGFLSKFFSPFLWVGLVFFFLWVPSYRPQLRRPGPWLALGLNLLGAVPVILWNASHGWITATHLQERGGLDQARSFDLVGWGQFVGAVAALLNPVFFIAILSAVVGFVRMKDKPPLWRFFFCASVPVFIFYLLLATRAKAQPNWIGPAAPALFLFAVLWWHQQWQWRVRAPLRWLAAGVIVGLPIVLLMHETRLLHKAFRVQISAKRDPLNRVRGGSDLARIVGEERQRLEKQGQPVFLIADHYGRASLLNFYLPESRALLPQGQLAYVLSSDKPQNQYWFWPSYTERYGENAIYVVNGKGRRKAPRRLQQEFARVESLGTHSLRHDGRVCGQVQLFACYGKLRPGEVSLSK